MKIGIVCYPTFGGSGVIATELGMALANKGHEVHFITYNQPVRLNFLSENIHFHEVFIKEYPLFQYQPYELALSSKIVSVVERYNLEILHVHYAIPHAYAAFMAKQMLKEMGKDVKLVTTLHGTDITLVGSHPNYKRAVEFSINNSDVVTAVSLSLKNDTMHLFDIKKDIKVIHNFIDLNKYPKHDDKDCERHTLAKPYERIITHISNFRPVKRVIDVIDIFYKIQQEIPAKLLMVGEGPDREIAENHAKKLDIKHKIVFLGNSHDVNKILCYSDLFLLPSTTESFGLAALEAMAAKTPVISSNAGGLPEVNLQAKTGFLKDDNVLDVFKQNAFDNAAKFTLPNILPRYEEIYREVLNG